MLLIGGVIAAWAAGAGLIAGAQTAVDRRPDVSELLLIALWPLAIGYGWLGLIAMALVNRVRDR